MVAPPASSWKTSWLLALGLVVASVGLLLVLQSEFGSLLAFWPYLLAAPVVLTLLRGPLWGSATALLVAGGQVILPWLSGGYAARLENVWPGIAACAVTGVLAAAGTHALRRSHRARREEAQVSTAQLRLATVTGDPSSLQTLLAAAVRTVPQLTGRGFCALFLWEPAPGRFALAEQSLPGPGQRSLPAKLTLSPDQFPPLRELLDTRDTVVTRSQQIAGSSAAEIFQSPNLAMVPLVNWGNVLGCLLLAGEVRQKKGRSAPAPFTPRELEVASGLANQVAVAIANAHLYQEILRQKELLSAEQQKSERLLLNILPAPIADRLKEHEATIADSFVEVTVLFADIVDFTAMSARLSPEALVNLLNGVFTEFDRLAEEHGLEKIKTIGDAYMVVGGLPVPRADHVEAVAEMGLAMTEIGERFRRDTGEPLQLRIGIHTGPVVAGVIGTRKFIYDLWGDTVNTASRMESHGVPGRIQVTAATRARLDGRYGFEERGPIEIKGKGLVSVYLLSRSGAG